MPESVDHIADIALEDTSAETVSFLNAIVQKTSHVETAINKNSHEPWWNIDLLVE